VVSPRQARAPHGVGDHSKLGAHDVSAGGASYGQASWGAAAVTATPASEKELWDKTHHGDPSFRDLAADGVGLIAGAVMMRRSIIENDVSAARRTLAVDCTPDVGWCVTLSVQGALLRREPLARSGSRGLHAAAFFSADRIRRLGYAFLTNEFRCAMWRCTPVGICVPVYKVGAVWSGRGRNRSVGVSVYSLVAAAAASRSPRVIPTAARRVKVAVLGALLLPAFISAFGGNPFARIARAPADGRAWIRSCSIPALLAVPLLALGAPPQLSCLR